MLICHWVLAPRLLCQQYDLSTYQALVISYSVLLLITETCLDSCKKCFSTFSCNLIIKINFYSTVPKDSPPSNFNSISNPSEDPKLLVVTGIPGTDQVDLNNLPGPGDPGAPVPPDEIDNNPAQGSYIRQVYIGFEFFS